MEQGYGAESVRADFFDVIALSPAEVAAGFPEPQPFEDPAQLLAGFIGLPMTADHRKEFIAGLHSAIKTPRSGSMSARQCLLNLLEEDGRYDEALAVLRGGHHDTLDDGIREVRLLWQAGRETEARELAARMTGTNADDAAWHSPVLLDLIRNRADHALEFLTFLENHATLPPEVRYAFALQHLELARRQDDATRLIEQTTSPVLRAVWNAALGKTDQALAGVAAADPITRPSDLELLVMALGPEPSLIERTKALLATAAPTPEQRASLLKRFTNSNQRLELWAGMESGHGETVEVLETRLSSLPTEELAAARRTSVQVLAKHPDDARLQLLAAILGSFEPDQGKPLLLQAATAVRAGPETNSQFSDPASGALRLLVKMTTAADLDKLLQAAPGFARLPVDDQLRYWMAADLDTRVAAAFADRQFDQPDRDALSQSFAGYFTRCAATRVVPAATLAMLIDRLPELVCGNPARELSKMGSLASEWSAFLATQPLPEPNLAKCVNQLSAAAAQRGPEAQRAVLGALPEPIRKLRGLEFIRPTLMSGTQPKGAGWWSCLAIFAPPNPACGDRRSLQHPPLIRDGGLNRRPFTPSQMPGVYALLCSPWEQNVAAAMDHFRTDPQATAALTAKLRPLFDETDPRATVHDLFVSTGDMACPDPDVKTLADRRAADLTNTPPQDPAIALYLFFRRLEKREPFDQAVTALKGIQDLPPARARMLVGSASYGMQRFRENADDVRKAMVLLGAKPPVKPPQAPKRISPYDRLQAFHEAGTNGAPEAIALAREVLFRFVDSQGTKPEPEQNVAITTLVQARKFDAFIEDLISRMKGAGRSELDVQRALHSVHLYSIIHSHGETLPFAKRIYELDPTDASAAREVLGAAIHDENRPLVLKCLDTLCRNSRRSFCGALCDSPANGPLHLFTGPRARDLAQALLRIPLAPAVGLRRLPSDERNTYSLLPLYQHILQYDPDDLKPLMDWAGALTVSNIREIIQFAEFFKQTQRPQDGVEMLAKVLFTPPSGDGEDSLRFPQRVSPLEDFLPQAFPPPACPVAVDPKAFCLTELTAGGWLKPLVGASAGFPECAATAGVRTLVGLAADPQPSTWDRLAKPYLASLPLDSRPRAIETLENMTRNLSGSAALLRHIAAFKAAPSRVPEMLNEFGRDIVLAAEAAEPAKFGPLWEGAKPLMAKYDPNQRLEFLARIATPFAMLADDALWTEYLASVGSYGGFGYAWGQAIHRGAFATFASLPPRRQHDLAAVILPTLKPGSGNYDDPILMFDSLVLADPPDLEMLRRFRPWLENPDRHDGAVSIVPAKVRLLDLLCGDPRAASPVVAVTRDGASSWRIEWSLAGFKGCRGGFPYSRKFPFLDGKFDLEFLAGPDPDRLERTATAGQAACTGMIEVKPPAGARFVTLLARQHDGDLVLWSHPVALDESPDATPVTLAPPAPGNPGAPVAAATIPDNGPFFRDDALDLTAAPETAVELARLPWNEGPAPVVSGWFLNGLNQGNLKLSFRSSGNVEFGSSSIGSDNSELANMPLWQHFVTSHKVLPPPETEIIALVFQPASGKNATSCRIAGVRVVPPRPVPVPDGLVPLGRIRGGVGLIAMDPASNRFAAASNTQGVGVFDLTTQQFAGWIPLDPAAPAKPLSVAWLGLAGERIVCQDGTGGVHLVSIAKRTARVIDRIDRKGAAWSLRLSADGRFLAWSGAMAGVHLIRISEDGGGAERELETGRIHRLQFNQETHSLEAADQDNKYHLALDDWEKAPLQITRDEPRDPPLDEPRKLVFGPNERLLDSRYQVTFEATAEDAGKVEMDPSFRIVRLPRGLLALDGNGNPFHISTFGRIHRIETTRIKGYQPPKPGWHQ